MNLFLLLSFAAVAGYAIPVLASLGFSLSVGSLAPERVARGGRIQRGFVVVHGLVWTLATVASGYVISRISPEFRLLTCLVTAGLLVGALWSNVDEMKKRQSPLRMVSMTVATAAGMVAGFGIYWAEYLRVA